MRHKTSGDARLAVIDAAYPELDKDDPTPYWDVVYPYGGPRPKHWCGAFALRCYVLAGLCDWKWMIRDGYCFRLNPPRKWRDGDPLDGSVFDIADTAYFARAQHHALVWGWQERQVRLIQGNGAGGKVTTSLVDVGDITAFYSIASLVEPFDKTPRGDEPEDPPPADPLIPSSEDACDTPPRSSEPQRP